MSAILPRLPHIQKLSLDVRITNYNAICWPTSLPKDFVAAIQALCRSPNLTTLYLDGIQDFPFMSACPNLRCLRLWRSGLADDDVNSRHEISSSHLLHLESLEVDLVYPLGSHISENGSIAKYFSRLKNLQLKDLFFHATSLVRGWKIMLLALQTLQKLELTMTANHCRNHYAVETSLADLGSLPFDLGRFPALRHFKIEENCYYLKNQALLRFLTCILSISSSPIGIEVLEIKITWFNVEDGHRKFLFSDPGWFTLDGLFTSQRFVSLRKVVLRLELRMAGRVQPPHILELEKNLTLPHLNDLFPSFRAANTQRTLEIHLKVCNDPSPL